MQTPARTMCSIEDVVSRYVHACLFHVIAVIETYMMHGSLQGVDISSEQPACCVQIFVQPWDTNQQPAAGTKHQSTPNQPCTGKTIISNQLQHPAFVCRAAVRCADLAVIDFVLHVFSATYPSSVNGALICPLIRGPWLAQSCPDLYITCNTCSSWTSALMQWLVLTQAIHKTSCKGG